MWKVGTVTALLMLGITSAASMHVSLLANHDATAWTKGSPCHNTSKSLATCNAQLFASAATTAAAAGASVLVLPEGYGLVGTPTKTSYYEPLLPQSTRACTDGLQIGHPIQYTLACAAKENAITIASNIFVELPNNTRRITEIVYSADGESVAVYDKHHLFPGESKFFTPGPFNPTTFELSGSTMGIIICYEGFYPDVSGDWSQMTSLVSMNATAFAWSVGMSVGVLPVQAKIMSKRFKTAVVGTEDKEGGSAHDAITTAAGDDATSTTAQISQLPKGYSGAAYVRAAAI